MDPSPLPVIRLKPKADARRVRHGAPWIEAGDLVLDRRTRSLAPGSIALLEDADRGPLGVVAVHPEARIAARMLDRDPAARVDGAWLSARLARALALRERLFGTPYYRLVHAEADDLPGLIVDRFGDIAVIQPNAAWIEARLPELVEALRSVAGIGVCVKNAGSRARKLEGLDEAGAVLAGSAPEGPVPVQMNGATYLADLTGGQKTGLFYDQRPNHAAVARLAAGARVLDVFSHIGGFSLAALAAGAAGAVAVDASDAALALARGGAEASGLADRFATRAGDGFEVLAALGAAGESFDIVVCDPPAFAPAKPALQAGLRAYERVARLAAPLVADGGFLVLCSCSHAADLRSFSQACQRGIGRAGRVPRLIRTGFAGPDHPVHPVLSDSGYLKCLTYRL